VLVSYSVVAESCPAEREIADLMMDPQVLFEYFAEAQSLLEDRNAVC